MTEKDQPTKPDSKAVTDLSGNLPQQENPRTFFRWVIPWDVAGRIGLLFMALCAIKLAMLIGFQVHLYEIHWRLDEAKPPRGFNPAAFFIFSILVAASLWRLGERCATGGVQTVRAANACALVFGALLIFLTFLAGTHNYFYLLMNGTGTWEGLKAAFFSEQPLWSVWLLIYLMLYFVFVRLGIERLILRVTAVIAALYIILMLRHLMNRNALLVADCMGVACLLAGKKTANSLGWFWLLQPFVWAAFLFFIFRWQVNTLSDLNPHFAVLSGWTFVILAGTSLFAWRRKFYPAWSWLLPFAFASSLVLINADYNYAPNYQHLLCMGFMLPHYFLGEFFLAAALLGLAMVYRRFLPSSSLLWLDGINLLLITFALADLRLSQIMGVRLDWQAVNIAGGFIMMWRQAKPYLPDMVFGLIMLVSLYAVLTGFLKRIPPKKTLLVGPGGWFLLIAFLLLGITGRLFVSNDKVEGESAILLAQTSPWFNWAVNPIMDDKTFTETARQLGLEQMLVRPAATPSRSPRDLNVVFIFQESSYNKYLSLFDGKTNTQPLLSKYKARMELFPDFFSSYPGSINARFAALSGLYPVRNYEAFTFHRVDVKSIFDVLHEQGYASSVFASDSFDYTDFRDFLRGRGIDTMYDAETMPGRNGAEQVSWGVGEEVTLKAIQSQIRQYAASRQKFFLSYFPVAPHNPFDGIPPQFQKFPVKKKDDFVPQYQNALLYLDWVISSIIDQLKDSGLLDHTLVIITDDHGEMLGENGGPIGHGWAVTPRLTNIPLIIMDPDNPGYHINDTVGSQVDLLPTILDLLGIPVPQGQLYQGVSLYSPMAQDDRKIYLNSFQQYGVIEDHHLLCGDRETDTSTATNDFSSRFYSITNNGILTIFPKINSPDISPPSISQFDKFQENFLQNYSHYTLMIHSMSPAGN